MQKSSPGVFAPSLVFFFSREFMARVHTLQGGMEPPGRNLQNYVYIYIYLIFVTSIWVCKYIQPNVIAEFLRTHQHLRFFFLKRFLSSAL